MDKIEQTLSLRSKRYDEE